MERILYYLYDETENKVTQIKNDLITITITQGNKSFLTSPAPGARCTRIYVDQRLNTFPYREWIDEVLRPMLTLSNSQEILFI